MLPYFSWIWWARHPQRLLCTRQVFIKESDAHWRCRLTVRIWGFSVKHIHVSLHTASTNDQPMTQVENPFLKSSNDLAPNDIMPNITMYTRKLMPKSSLRRYMSKLLFSPVTVEVYIPNLFYIGHSRDDVKVVTKLELRYWKTYCNRLSSCWL
jgi:hypothetical protein